MFKYQWGAAHFTLAIILTIAPTKLMADDVTLDRDIVGTYVLPDHTTLIIPKNRSIESHPKKGKKKEGGIYAKGGGKVINYGRIYVHDASKSGGEKVKSAGIEFDWSAGTVRNYGEISGARHGVDSHTGIKLRNEKDGIIIGRNGSGVGSDGKGVVINYGRITGETNDHSKSGDGDGVDIDGEAQIKNYGIIEGKASKGHKDGDPSRKSNASEAISIGGGNISNYPGGVIDGGNNGILVDDSGDVVKGPAPEPVTIINAGTIKGRNGYGIFVTSKPDSANTITNAGTISADDPSGHGKAIGFSDGINTLNIRTGSVIHGAVIGGRGRDTLNFGCLKDCTDGNDIGGGVFAGASGFEIANVNGGTWTLTGSEHEYTDGINVNSSSSLIAADASRINSKVTVNDGGMLGGTGTIGELVVNTGGTLSPGNSVGVLNVKGNATFSNGSIFDVEIAKDKTSADRLAVEGKVSLLGGAVTVRMAGDTTQLSQNQTNELMGKQFYIVTAGEGVEGSFEQVTPQYNYVTARLDYSDRSHGVRLDFNLTQEARSEATLKKAAELAAALQEDRGAEPVSEQLSTASQSIKPDKLSPDSTNAAPQNADPVTVQEEKRHDVATHWDRPDSQGIESTPVDTAPGTGEAHVSTQAKLEADHVKTEKINRLRAELLAMQVRELELNGATSFNQKSVGEGIKSLGIGNRLMNDLFWSKIGITPDYDSVSGEAHATLAGVLMGEGHFVGDSANNRLRAAFGATEVKQQTIYAPLAFATDERAKAKSEVQIALESKDKAHVEAGWTTGPALWGQAYGGWSHADSDGNTLGYSHNTGGFVTGLDGTADNRWQLGLLTGYGVSRLHMRTSSASVDSYRMGVYGGTQWDMKENALGMRLGVNLSRHEIATSRYAQWFDLSEQDQASYGATGVQGFGEIGYTVNTVYGILEPFMAIRYERLRTDGFSERGGITALSALPGTTHTGLSTLGLRASHVFTLGDTTTVTAHGLAGWSHTYGNTAPKVALAFAGGERFTVQGLPLERDALNIEAGLDFNFGRAIGDNSTSFGISYTGQFSSQVHDNAVKADLTVTF